MMFTHLRAGIIVGVLGISGPLLAVPLSAPAAHATQPATLVIPADGHFHPLAAPARLLSTSAGVGAPRKPLPAQTGRVVTLGGKSGIPSQGVRAVSATLTAMHPSGTTQLWADAGPTRPTVPNLTTTGRTTSAFAVIPVAADGTIHVWNGAHPADVTLDVTGWFSDGPESGAAGLLNRLASRQVKAARLKAGATKTWTLAGLEDVPASGTSALLLRLHTRKATRPGELTVAPTATSTKAVTSLAYPSGAADDLAVSRMSDNGSVVLSNRGTKAVTVVLDAVASFTDGTSELHFGDTLRLAPPAAVLQNTTVSSDAVVAAVAGVHGIPAESVSEPPSLVLLRTVADRAAKATALTADPAGATATRVPVLTVGKGQATAGVVLAAPGPSGSSSFAATAGTVRVTLSSFGWFAGGIQVSPDLHVLTPEERAAVTAVTTDSVVFRDAPASIVGLPSGAVLSAGATPNTPDGLLRVVDAVSADQPEAGMTTVSTSPGSLDQVILQGHISTGAASPATLQAAARQSAAGRPAETGGRARPAVGGLTECPVTGNSLGTVGATISCSHTFNKDGISLDVTGTSGFGLDVQVDFWHHIVPTYYHVTVTTQDVASATLSAGGTADFDETYDLPHISLTQNFPITIPLGEVPLVLYPYITPKLKVSGHAEAGVFASGEVSLTTRLDMDSVAGVNEWHKFGHQHDANFTGHVTPISIKPQFIGAATVFFYDNPWFLAPDGPTPEYAQDFANGGGIWGGYGIEQELEIDACTVHWSFSLHYNIGAVFLVIGHDLLGDVNKDFEILPVHLPALPWRNCAVWSGSFTFRASGHHSHDGYSRTVKASTAASLDAVETPPDSGIYPVTASGSGLDKRVTAWTCGNPPIDTTYTTVDRWGGTVATTLGKPTITFGNGLGPGDFVASIYPADYTYWTVPGEEDLDWYGTADDGSCTTEHSEQPIDAWWSYVFAFVDKHVGMTSTLNFHLNPGDTWIKGTRTYPAQGDEPGFTLSFMLTKRCLLGGTACTVH